MEEPNKVLIYYTVKFVEYDRVFDRQYGTLEEATADAVAFSLNEFCSATVYKHTREQIS